MHSTGTQSSPPAVISMHSDWSTAAARKEAAALGAALRSGDMQSPPGTETLKWLLNTVGILHMASVLHETDRWMVCVNIAWVDPQFSLLGAGFSRAWYNAPTTGPKTLVAPDNYGEAVEAYLRHRHEHVLADTQKTFGPSWMLVQLWLTQRPATEDVKPFLRQVIRHCWACLLLSSSRLDNNPVFAFVECIVSLLRHNPLWVDFVGRNAIDAALFEGIAELPVLCSKRRSGTMMYIPYDAAKWLDCVVNALHRSTHESVWHRPEMGRNLSVWFASLAALSSKHIKTNLYLYSSILWCLPVKERCVNVVLHGAWHWYLESGAEHVDKLMRDIEPWVVHVDPAMLAVACAFPRRPGMHTVAGFVRKWRRWNVGNRLWCLALAKK